MARVSKRDAVAFRPLCPLAGSGVATPGLPCSAGRMSSSALFHLAFNVTDLDEARHFYAGVLGCTEGRSTDTWVDFDFHGHQLSLHLGEPFKTAATGRVGDVLVPMPHFGL